MIDGVEEGDVEESKRELLLENLCWVSNIEEREEAVLGVCGYEGGKPAERTGWLKREA